MNRGGPAFPRPASEDRTQGTLPDGDCHIDGQKGMDLRDYFAAKAMPAVMMARALMAEKGLTDGLELNQESIAEECYALADALIVEREKERS